MINHNSWLSHNLDERLIDKSVPFRCEFSYYPFTPINFHDAADRITNMLGEEYDKRFLSFSGGIDSEYVLRCFVRNKIDITPIIVISPVNRIEVYDALLTCKELSVKPVVIKVTEEDLIRCYYTNIVCKLNATGIGSASTLLAGRYARENGGCNITGEHPITDDDRTISIDDFMVYNDALIDVHSGINFYCYTVEMLHAMITQFKLPFMENKHKLYQLQYRKKQYYRFSSNNMKVIGKINDRSNPTSRYKPDTSNETLDALKMYINIDIHH